MGISNHHAIWKAEAEGIDLLNITIGDLLDQQAAAIPVKEALVYNYPELGLSLRLNYRQYREEADRLAKGLLALGIAKGEHVAVWATNLPEWALLEMALAKIGAVLVTIKMPEETAESMDADGWLRTGDLATMNAQGYINIVGRVKDMIIRGGENLFPAEIEAFLMRHPKIAEAQVVGVPDSLMGEEAAALLRLKPETSADENEIREYCRTGISRHKIPKYIRFVTEFPLTASGKVKKFELQAQLIQELGLENLKEMRTA
jgi:acyl-CoA synthetase (AMP-forming)/AMP-acid ligase II